MLLNTNESLMTIHNLRQKCKKEKKVSRYICFSVALMIFCSLCNCTISSEKATGLENHGLVEVYVSAQIAPHKTSFPSEKLETESNGTISCICYDLFYEDSSYPSYTQHPYGYQY